MSKAELKKQAQEALEQWYSVDEYGSILTDVLADDTNEEMTSVNDIINDVITEIISNEVAHIADNFIADKNRREAVKKWNSCNNVKISIRNAKFSITRLSTDGVTSNSVWQVTQLAATGEKIMTRYYRFNSSNVPAMCNKSGEFSRGTVDSVKPLATRLHALLEMDKTLVMSGSEFYNKNSRPDKFSNKEIRPLSKKWAN